MKMIVDRRLQISSRWVGLSARPTRKVLAPVRLDLVAPPLGFGEVQYADLAAWSGGADDPRFQHFLAVVQAIVRAEPMPVAPRPTHFEAPGIKLQGVTMQNVNIHVGERGRDDDDDAEEEETPVATRTSKRERASSSPSMFLTRAIGVIFPLVGIIIFIFAMGGMACDAGNAPGAFCRALDALRQ